MEDWGAVRARLAALERDEEQAAEIARLRDLSVWGTTEPVGEKYDEIERLRQRVEELERAAARMVVSAQEDLNPWIKRAEAAEAKLARCVEARYAILSAYHDGPPEAMPLALQQLADALDVAKGE